MTNNTFADFKNFDQFVSEKITRFSNTEKDFKSLFGFMFSETENIFAEYSDGFRIKKITYGESKNNALKLGAVLCDKFSTGGIIGIYMDNSPKWIETFWAILISGNSPLLMNTRLDDGVLNKLLAENSVRGVISDGKIFSVPTFICADLFSNLPATPPSIDRDFGKSVIFMSSGTTDNVKLCFYTGENFYNQISDSMYILKTCPMIKADEDGNVKHLTLLPFYHVFGFIAVYVWFGFYSRTFVFLKDLLPQTIQSTVKRHKVTHIFAVPLVWESIYKSTLAKIKARGEKTYKKFNSALKFSLKTGLGKKAFKEIRENLFGDSVKFMISGGSFISKNALEFFNGIGYHLANGYGMTETGITSVELSTSNSRLTSTTIGKPFNSIEYNFNENGELTVKSKSRADMISVAGKIEKTNYDEPFNTRDLATEKKGDYFILGRADDLIVCENGENLNPQIAENLLAPIGCPTVIFNLDGAPTLLVGLHDCFVKELQGLNEKIYSTIKDAKLEGLIKKIIFTNEKLISGGEFKISRTKLAKKVANGTIKTFSINETDAVTKEKLSDLEKTITEIFATTLHIDASEITLNSDFFTELGGSSLDYFVLVDEIKFRFNTTLPQEDGKTLSTVKDVCDFLKG